MNFNPQPKIYLDEYQESEKTRAHLQYQTEQYGKVIIYNLIKENKIEKEIKELFEQEVQKLQDQQIQYNYINFLEYYNNKDPDLIYKMVLEKVDQNFKETQQFEFDMVNKKLVNQQKGILRVNCIDCLDRTNNFIGIDNSYVLAHQLVKLVGVDKIDQKYLRKDKDGKVLQVQNSLLKKFYEIYAINGDILAELYAGSVAFHKNQIEVQDDKQVKVKQSIVMPAIKRFINNNLLDWNKYMSIQLGLGNFKYQNKHIWEYKDTSEFQQSQYSIDDNDKQDKTFNCISCQNQQSGSDYSQYLQDQQDNFNIHRIDL